MRDFAGKVAVITGGGTGMGRELAKQLTAEGCSVALCDVSMANMEETKRQCEAAGLPQGTRIVCHVADVSDEAQLQAFQRAVADGLKTEKVHLLFNNAGIGGGGGFVRGTRAEWERTFNVCWYGVYYSCRVFLPMLLKAERAHVTNTSSVNGFWASIGPNEAHTAYPAAKFAVKGFTEALLTDFRLNAPHITASVVMPGHVGTAIMLNTHTEMHTIRNAVTAGGVALDEDRRQRIEKVGRAFEERAPTSAAEAATIILDGVRANRWRILVGEDAQIIDKAVRAEPERVYDADWRNPMGLSLEKPAR
ncbi:MAG: SDR family NAD(P)-dependent oxidoreductase [Alphaproteobacteria bacterium]|nr:SDR family NAD(P)-dependent oxidoreductase [Alphaproteobacteria bacterium]